MKIIIGAMVFYALMVFVLDDMVGQAVEASEISNNAMIDEGCVVKESYFGVIKRWECPDGSSVWK